MSFNGFSPEARTFVAELPNRDPAWFKSHKKQYEALVALPTKALVQDLGERLAAIRPGLVAVPKTNGSIAPINNDLRFSPDKPPYKDHLLLKFWEGEPKKTAPTVYVRIAPDNVGFAVGLVPADVGSWREFVSGSGGERFADAIRKLERSKKADVVGQSLKRVPAPYDSDHPQADLLRHKMLQVRWPEPVPKAIHSGAFSAWCLKRLQACLPVHEMLVEGFS